MCLTSGRDPQFGYTHIVLIVLRVTKQTNYCQQGPRAQIDRLLCKKHMQEEIFNTANLSVEEHAVEDLLIAERDGRTECEGVITGKDFSRFLATRHTSKARFAMHELSLRFLLLVMCGNHMNTGNGHRIKVVPLSLQRAPFCAALF